MGMKVIYGEQFYSRLNSAYGMLYRAIQRAEAEEQLLQNVVRKNNDLRYNLEKINKEDGRGV